PKRSRVRDLSPDSEVRPGRQRCRPAPTHRKQMPADGWSFPEGAMAQGVTNAEARFKLFAIAPAQGKSGPSLEHHLVISVAVQLQASHSIQVDDGRPVNATKRLLVQAVLQFRHATAQQVLSLSHMQARVVVCSFNPIDVRDLDE